jgi:hypothetical protein
MRRSVKRWILSPVIQWRALRFARVQRAGMNVEIAWLLMALRARPDEASYALGASGLPKSDVPGVRFDNWDDLTTRERKRRNAWLATYGRSPFQLLRVDSALLERAGVEVTDWGSP